MTWRVGKNVPVNVYDDERPVCQTHTAVDARRIVAAVNEYGRRTKAAHDFKNRLTHLMLLIETNDIAGAKKEIHRLAADAAVAELGAS
jgi:hypothetical protein